jgi:CheY-like chemotaxis protein
LTKKIVLGVLIERRGNVARIWVVEDDRAVLQLIAEYLHIHGHDVVTYESGVRVIEDLKEGKLPTLIILDIVMPEVDGNEVLDYVNQTGNPPVVVVTGYLGSLNQALVKVPVNILAKPFKYQELLDTIQRVCHG